MTYYAVRGNGETTGPHTVEELQQLADDGKIQRDTMLRAEDGTEMHAEALGLTFPPLGGPQGEPPPQMMAPAKAIPWALIIGFGLAFVAAGCIILAAILFPVFVQANLAAKQTETLSRMKRIGVALNIYLADFDGRFPPDMSSAAAIQPAMRVYSRDVIYESLNPKSKEFLGNNLLSGASAIDVADPTRTVTLFDSAVWPNDKRIVGLVDGSARKVSETEFESAMGRAFELP